MSKTGEAAEQSMALTPLDNYNGLIAPALGGAVAVAAKCIGQDTIILAALLYV